MYKLDIKKDVMYAEFDGVIRRAGYLGFTEEKALYMSHA